MLKRLDGVLQSTAERNFRLISRGKMFIQIHKALFDCPGTGKEVWFACLLHDNGRAPFCHGTGRYDPDFVHNAEHSKEDAIRLGISILQRRGMETTIRVDPRDGSYETYDHTGKRLA